MSGERSDLDAFAVRLGHRFADPRLLEAALTHPSGAQEAGIESYQRLEFLGDAVLGLLTAEWLYDEVADPEGELSRLKSWLVSEPVLADRARQLAVGEALRLGVGEDRSGGRDKDSLLADALEAVIAALYLDGGLEAARRVVAPLLAEGAERMPLEPAAGDPKTALQEALQAAGRPLPEYLVASESGPDHRKRFEVDCQVDGATLGRGSGSSKKRAEKAAAAAALDALRAAGPLSPP